MSSNCSKQVGVYRSTREQRTPAIRAMTAQIIFIWINEDRVNETNDRHTELGCDGLSP